MSDVRAVFGLPLYNQTEHLSEALESLLDQSYKDLAVVVVDDSTEPESGAIVRRYAKVDGRVAYHHNERRLGMVGNWRRAFEVARKRYPDAPYFAWASDHDIWHPHWLAAMIEALDTNPDVVAAFPLVIHLSEDGNQRRSQGATDSLGVSSRMGRLWGACMNTSAGNAVYGLFRADTVARAGIFRPVLLPDRLFMTELALYGQFKQVPEYLWIRRHTAPYSMARQRASLFGETPPRYLWAPWLGMHTGVLVRELVVRGRGKPMLGRAEGVSVVFGYIAFTMARQTRRAMRTVRVAIVRFGRRFRDMRVRFRRRLGATSA